jgi:hypothetical protein
MSYLHDILNMIQTEQKNLADEIIRLQKIKDEVVKWISDDNRAGYPKHWKLAHPHLTPPAR